MNIRCMIVDDEPPAQRLVRSYCARVPGLEVMAICNSAVEAKGVLRQQQIDLIFLDIKMPQLSGMDFIRGLDYPPKVILITAYREYALDGYELDIVDYLLKPVSLGRFQRAVAKAARLLSSEGVGFSESADDTANKESFLYFRIDKEMVKVLLEEILFIESRKEYAKFYLEGNRSLLVKQSISSLENLLSPHRFIRIHRSYMVTKDKVFSYTATQIKIGDFTVPIGRLYKNNVDDLLRR